MIQTNTLKEKVELILPRVAKPARYVGGELNIIRKNPEEQNIRVCLAFPDIYDIGQSYIGFYILYHILNNRAGTLCERAFAPWVDMEALMREEDIPLWSLESFLPVSHFDVVGFTLQYELHYMTVLNMLDLAGIPVLAENRDETHPLIIGGGPCCVNPEPVADFFDAFLLGDGEEAFPEILDVIERCRQTGISRCDTLTELAGIDGVYVPSLYRPHLSADGAFAGMEKISEKASLPVRSRIVEELKPEYYPVRPLVPMCEIVHDRLAVEIMRGCSRGCRFCGAGMIYRPRRTRPVEDVVRQIVSGIQTTGWEDVSLVSLSNSDYPGLERVVERIGAELKGKAVSISLSSLRADNFSLKMAETVAGGKRTSLTFAIEAGTQRLRNVINKNLTEEQLFETAKTALEGGWNSFKLYFMIGLPTETDEDVLEIAKLLNRLGSLLKQYRGRRINVTVSTFCPKPHTPFQWEEQDSVSKLRGKIRIIIDNLRSRAIHIKATDPHVSMLESLLGRGGREMGKIILDAWKMGSRLDGWSENFNSELWSACLKKAGILMENGGMGIKPGSPLPWSHIDFGIDEAYLLSELEKTYAGECTSDCMEKCHNCGSYKAFCALVKKSQKARSQSDSAHKKTAIPDAIYGRKKKSAGLQKSPAALFKSRIRVKFGKNGMSRFTGQLDLIRIFDRTFRRSGIPVAYTQGFHPHPKMSFGPSLPLGMKSIAEYVDFSLSAHHPDIESALREGFPEGFSLIDLLAIPEKTESLNEIIRFAEYGVKYMIDDTARSKIEKTLESESIPVERWTKKGTKTVDIRPGIVDIHIEDDRSGFTMLLSLEKKRMAKAAEVLKFIFGDDIPRDVIRIEQYIKHNGERITPLEIFRQL